MNIQSCPVSTNLQLLKSDSICLWDYHQSEQFSLTRNTFYGTRYLSHCCVLFCIKTFVL